MELAINKGSLNVMIISESVVQAFRKNRVPKIDLTIWMLIQGKGVSTEFHSCFREINILLILAKSFIGGPDCNQL